MANVFTFPLETLDHDNIRDLLDRFKHAHEKKDEQLCTDSELRLASWFSLYPQVAATLTASMS